MIKACGFLILSLMTTITFAQTTTNNCNCCSAPYQQFDFWVGDWNVFDTSGKKIGENSIVYMQDSCLIQENWTSMGKHSGTSYNFYNMADSSWNQVWVANNGNVLVLKGKRTGNKMILKSDQIKGDKVAYYFNQITWEQNPDGSVIQQWDILDDKNNNLSAVFKGIYRKK